VEFGFVPWSVANVFSPRVPEVWGIVFVGGVDED
jgi:hypothetical protein